MSDSVLVGCLSSFLSWLDAIVSCLDVILFFLDIILSQLDDVFFSQLEHPEGGRKNHKYHGTINSPQVIHGLLYTAQLLHLMLAHLLHKKE